MEFWGVEVKSGQTLSVQPGDGMVVHLSQASLGELKKDKGSESACLSVNVDNKKLVLGTLNLDKVPQQQFDLVFDRDFELSHNLKSGSVYFLGYKAANPCEDEEDEDDEDESDEELPEEIPLAVANNGKPKAKTELSGKAASKASASDKQKVDSSDDDEEDSEMGEDEDSDEDGSSESEEESPKKASKKRALDTTTKTPAADKKTKFATPQKTDGKKSGAVHVATPYPSKQASKAPANRPNQTPKSGGSHSCKTCNRTFGSEGALESHSKAKHSTGK